MSLQLSDTRVCEPQIRARFVTAAQFCEVVFLKLRAAQRPSTSCWAATTVPTVVSGIFDRTVRTEQVMVRTAPPTIAPTTIKAMDQRARKAMAQTTSKAMAPATTTRAQPEMAPRQARAPMAPRRNLMVKRWSNRARALRVTRGTFQLRGATALF